MAREEQELAPGPDRPLGIVAHAIEFRQNARRTRAWYGSTSPSSGVARF
jgi:hypothetical protein